MQRAIAMIDGEHHPLVIRDALNALAGRGYTVVAAVFMGGGEKLATPLDLGQIPLVALEGDQAATLRTAIAAYAPEVVVDVCDAPVIDEPHRLALAALTLASGVAYHGADFAFTPQPRPRLCAAPSIAILGSAKRAGKTAIAGYLARLLTARGHRVVVVAMGRGGPGEPVLIRGDEAPPDAAGLLQVAAAGGHAASDFYEDAVLARVPAVGARRAGAGLAGSTMTDTVAAAVQAANTLAPDLIILEGSGTAIPPVHADAAILVSREADDVGAGIGSVRLLLADHLVVTMCEESPVASSVLSDLFPSLRYPAGAVTRTVFRPEPIESIAGSTVFYTTTAPKAVNPQLRTHLERAHGARIVGISNALGNRRQLEDDLQRANGTYDVLLTELKAAAIDVAARIATNSGARVTFAANEPQAVDGDLDAALLATVETAAARFLEASS